jgi:hypothetical protein
MIFTRMATVKRLLAGPVGAMFAPAIAAWQFLPVLACKERRALLQQTS